MRFEEGQEIRELWWPNGECSRAGSQGIDAITVVMEFGQAAGVPWFAVWKDGRVILKHNAAFVETVVPV